MIQALQSPCGFLGGHIQEEGALSDTAAEMHPSNLVREQRPNPTYRFIVNDSGYPLLASSSNIDDNTVALGHQLAPKLGQ